MRNNALPFVVATVSLLSFGCGGSSALDSSSGASAPTPTNDVASTRMIGGDRRLAVRNECWYALNRDWLNRPNDDNGPSNERANWSWLSKEADANANGARFILRKNGYAVSYRWPETGAIPANLIEQRVREFTDPSYTWSYGGVKNVGHGGQCISFANLVIYRALNGLESAFFTWSKLNAENNGSASNAQPGDVVFYGTSGNGGHVAICVRRSGGGMTVVDSNWVGNANNEVIGRHDVSASETAGRWKLYSGRGRWY